MNNTRVFILTLILVCFAIAASGSASQQQDCEDPCGKPTAWQDFNSFTLKAGSSGQAAYSQWQVKFDKESNDIQVDVEQSVPGTVAKGKILMIGGRIMAIQGPIAEPGYEIDALDAANLQLQLVTKLLGRALPNGPASVRSTQAIDFTDSKTGVQIATPSAGGMIQPPWRLVGELKRLPADGIQYTLTLTSRSGSEATNERHESTVTFAGTLFNSANTKIDDQLSLEKWNLFSVGPQARKQQGTTIIDYGAAPMTTTYKTVAEIRKKIQADRYAGKADPAKDFTVISENELKEQSTDGWDTYRRCTKDTHPVLKYKEKQ